MTERCEWMIDANSTSSLRRRCSKLATVTVIEFGRSVRDYCEPHARLSERDNDGARRPLGFVPAFAAAIQEEER